MNRILVFSDIHLHNFRSFAKVDPQTGKNTRLIDGLNVLWQMKVYAQDHDIRNILFCGDLFHDSRKIEPDMLEEVMEWMWECHNDEIDMAFLHGQHDHYAKAGEINSVSPFDGFVRIFDHDKISRINAHALPVSYYGCPNRQTVEEQKELLSSFDVELYDHQFNIFVGHFLVKELLQESGLMVDLPCVSYADLPKGFDLYLMGDYHVHTWIEELKLMSVGATHHHQFPTYERGPGGFIDLKINGKEFDFEKIDTEAPLFVKVLRPADFVASNPDIGNYYRVHVRDHEEEQDVRDHLPGYNIEFVVESDGIPLHVPEDRPQINLDLDRLSVIKRYCEAVGEEDVEYGKRFIA